MLPSDVGEAVTRFRKLRDRATEFEGAANVALRHAISLLVQHKFSLRDAGALLGMSHTAIDRLAAAYAKKKVQAPRIVPEAGEHALVVPLAYDRVNVFLAASPGQPGASLPVGHRVQVVELRHVPGTTLAVVDPLNGTPLVQMSLAELSRCT